MLQLVKSKRSIQSRLLEELLRLTSKTTPCTPKTEPKCDAFIESRREVNEKPYPSPANKLKQSIEETYIDGMQTFIWNRKDNQEQNAILYLHGGAYMNQPYMLHFTMVDEFARGSNAEVYFPIYPKIPTYTYEDAYPKLVELYRKICAEHTAGKITMMGDSSGGGLALGLSAKIEELGLPKPGKLILFSPWLDVRTDYSNIEEMQKLEPTLSPWRLRKMGRLWAGSDEKMASPYVSPMFLDDEMLKKLPSVTIFTGTHDILYPDVMRFDQILDKVQPEHQCYVFKKMNHDFIAYPIPESKMARKMVIRLLLNECAIEI